MGEVLSNLGISPTAQDLLGFLANLIQVVSFIVVIVLFWRERQRLRDYIKARETTISERPHALIIGIGGDISGQVIPWLEQNKLRDAERNTYTRLGRVSENQFYAVIGDLLKLKAEMTAKGATEVHLFYMGPVSLAVGIGAVLDNWVPVKVYQKEGNNYALYFVLEKETLLSQVGTGPGSQLGDVFKG